VPGCTAWLAVEPGRRGVNQPCKRGAQNHKATKQRIPRTAAFTGWAPTSRRSFLLIFPSFTITGVPGRDARTEARLLGIIG